jgi:hypothetical protein
MMVVAGMGTHVCWEQGNAYRTPAAHFHKNFILHENSFGL